VDESVFFISMWCVSSIFDFIKSAYVGLVVKLVRRTKKPGENND